MVKRIDPQTNTAFARVNLLSPTHQADDGSPVFMLVKRPDEELSFRHGEIVHTFLSREPGAQVTHIPHALRFVEDRYVFDFGGALFSSFGNLRRIQFNLSITNGHLQLSEHVIPVAMNDLDESAYLAFCFGLCASAAAIFLLLNLVSSQSFGENFYKRAVTGKINR